jgi:hypothetical protein
MVFAMTARQQLARLLPLAALVALAIIGLRGQVAGPRWDGPLKAYGVVIGVGLEVILGALLLITYYREHVARRQAVEVLLAAADDDPGDDRDVAATLRFLLKLAIGTAMAAIGVVLVMNAHLHLFTAHGIAGRGLLPKFKQKQRHLPARSHAGASPQFHFPLTPVLYGLLIVALIVALAFSIWWGRRLAAAVARPEAIPGDLAEEAEGLREAVASGRAAMADLDDARTAIIACYAAMERSLAERGAERGAAGTPDELLNRAVSAGLLRGRDGAARTLTALFYEARFSSHPLGPGQRAAAVRALDELAAELGDAPARADGTGAAR